MILGSHVSFGKEQLLGATKEALSYGANAFMFYTGAPSNTVRKPIDDAITYEAYKLMEGKMELEHAICHAPYIVNLANRLDEEKFQFSVNFIKQEISRCEALNVKYIVLHPGSSVGQEREVGIKNIIDGLNQILYPNMPVMVLLETMAGKGSECGTSLDEMKTIIDNVNVKESIGICIDTCHLNDAGYDMKKFDEFLDEFDEKIGLSKLKCVHVNDSKNNIGDHKDRHANIGFGTLGFDTLLNIIYHDKLKDVPKILETPYTGNSIEDKERLYPPYKHEIDMIIKKEFNPNLIEDIKNYYK